MIGVTKKNTRINEKMIPVTVKNIRSFKKMVGSSVKSTRSCKKNAPSRKKKALNLLHSTENIFVSLATMIKTLLFAFLALIFVQLPPVFAFSPPTDTQGALTVSIADPGAVTALNKAINTPVTLSNAGDAPLAGTLRVWVTDEWSVNGQGREVSQAFNLAAKESKNFPLAVTAGNGTYAALYPVHAQATVKNGPAPHAILILTVAERALTADGVKAWPTLSVGRNANISLLQSWKPGFNVGGGLWQSLPTDWQGNEATTGAVVSLQDVERGMSPLNKNTNTFGTPGIVNFFGKRRVLAVHPPWKTGWGEVALDYRVELGDDKPLALNFATAIRDSNANEPLSDGVQFDVLADDGNGFKSLFTRFSAAKTWEEGSVDLSDYAGKTITLRLLTGSGPAHNTSVDQAYWAVPEIVSGRTFGTGSFSMRREHDDYNPLDSALFRAKRAFLSTAVDGTWRLNDGQPRLVAAVAPGHLGLLDAVIVFATETQTLVFQGFDLQIDNNSRLGLATAGPMRRGVLNVAGDNDSPITSKWANGRLTIGQEFTVGARNVPVQAQIWAEKGALRMAFSMPGVQRDAKGSPRFTNLGIGPCSESVTRLYAGFGNVLQNPGTLEIRAGGFNLSTRHIGADYANGLSLVQATDVFPDSLSVNPLTNRCTLFSHHDTTFSFVPSTQGAFAAAKTYAQIAGFRAAGGVDKLKGKMCLDQWGGDYKKAAEDIAKAAAYGLSDAVFVKHVWQRWGYDYRLPDIYPPAGNEADFQAMVAACKKAGILFVPHDNYIDFYPDADGFSYDKIVFNADGTPQKAWLNDGRDAQSYRWLPTAFAPFLERNLKLMKNGFAPDGLFVDVFTAMPPIDFYDRAGNFYPKTVTQQKWGETFDRAREVFGNNAPTISEAGTDALIGHLDAGQSDHSGWFSPDAPRGTGNNANFGWRLPAGDGERIPWHDMATHGDFVLFAGGLGPRYAGGGDDFLHGYGSDDYLSLTVLGGRNPMSDGPFNRRAVMTYWLLHNISNKLAHSEMLSHQFAGDDIHRQVVNFQNATVNVNRGKADWQADGLTLPQYGFIAKAGEVSASIARRGGQITGFAQAPGVLFADARPVGGDGGAVRPRVLGVTNEGRKIRLRLAFDILRPVDTTYRPFLHFSNPKGEGGENISFQGGGAFDSQKLATPGTVEAAFEATLPETITAPDQFAIRPGFWNPEGGGRLDLAGPKDNGRARAGTLKVEFQNGQPVVSFVPEAADPEATEREARLNTTSKMIDFGPVVTNGAFRLQHAGADWILTPLPDSQPFDFILKLKELGAKSTNISAVTSIDMNGNPFSSAKIHRADQNVLSFRTNGAFAYKIHFTP